MTEKIPRANLTLSWRDSWYYITSLKINLLSPSMTPTETGPATDLTIMLLTTIMAITITGIIMDMVITIMLVTTAAIITTAIPTAAATTTEVKTVRTQTTPQT